VAGTTVYSALKFAHYPDRLRAIAAGRLAAPVHVRIKPINRCNHDCWYCAYRVSNLTLGETMDTRDAIPRDKMLEIADDFVACGVQAVTFSGGGEPLLYKPLPDVIERLAAGGIRIGCLTNGDALTGRNAEALACHATWVRISIDGWDDTSYARLRNVREGAFSRVLNNMRAFADRRSGCELGASVIITEDNHAHLADLVEKLKAAGCDHVKLAGVVVSTDGAENNAYHRRLAPTVNDEVARARALQAPGFTVVDHYHELDERFERPYTFCPNIQFNPVIGGDSQIYTCQDKAFMDDGWLGDLRERPFHELWFSEALRRRVYAVNPSRHCRHQCASHRKILTMLEYLNVDPEHGRFV